MKPTDTRLRLFAAVSGGALLLYLRTLAPSITWNHHGADSGDLAAAVATGGVPHPPGYPTYLLLGSLFNHLPLGDTAARLNLLSAVCAALAAGVMAVLMQRTLPGKERTLPAAAAALMLAFSGPVWNQAVITEVTTLHLLLAALLLYLACRLTPTNQSRLLPLLGGLLGVGLGNHLTLGLLAPGLVWLLKARTAPAAARRVILAFLVGLGVYGLIPIRAAAMAPVNWGLAVTPTNFWWLVSAAAYRPLLFGLPLALLPTRLLAGLYLLADAFMWWGLPVGLFGLTHLRRIHPRLAAATLTTFLLFWIYAAAYNSIDSHVLLLPALAVFAVWLGWGLAYLGDMLPAVISRRVGYVWLGLAMVSPVLNFSTCDLSGDTQALAYAQRTLAAAPAEAVILTSGDAETFALWYGRYGLGLRPDTAIVNTNLLPYGWYRALLAQHHPHLRLTDRAGRPVITAGDLLARNSPFAPVLRADPPSIYDTK
jgi:hypothetical protein